jgi:hypothetical protein
MRSFLNEIADKFIEIESNACNECNGMIVDHICESCGMDCNTVDEQNVTGAIAGYNTPGAFTSEKNFKKKKFKYESVNKPSTYKIGEHQRPESDEEVFNDKFPFATTDDMWWQSDAEFPVNYYSDGMGTGNIKDITTRTGNLPQSNIYKQVSKHTLRVEDVLEKKYAQLIEGYKDFKSGDVKPSSKVKSTIQEIAKKLQEIETLVNYNSKLKEEAGVTSTAYGPGTQKALTKISERLIKISERIRSLGA